MTSRNSRDDVVRAAGRMFAERGYHGTSMRDLGRELGLRGSSLYSHVASKEDLLVDVVLRGAAFFEAVAQEALEIEGSAFDRLEHLVAGHIDVVLDHVDEARTFLNEASSLDERHRRTVLAARDRYESAFRKTLASAKAEASVASWVDPKLATIFILSIVNSLDRWYREDGPLDRSALNAEIMTFVHSGLAPGGRSGGAESKEVSSS